MKKIVFVGRFTFDSSPCAGEVRKNQLLYERINSFQNISLEKVDLVKCRGKSGYIKSFIRILIKSLLGKREIILSTYDECAYKLLWMAKVTHIKLSIVYWVIGGGIHKKIISNNWGTDLYNNKYTIVEDDEIACGLRDLGIPNVMTLPNFKPIVHIQRKIKNNSIIRFVYVSRITALKGCDIIIAAANILNQREKKYVIDMYGPVEQGYPFEEYIANIDNINYKGIKKLCTQEDYEDLAGYSVLLFPTYYPNEGFPGTIIDGYMSGLPIIATKWRYNGNIVEDKKTGWLINHHDALELANTMEQIIDGKVDLNFMSECCFNKALEYDIDRIVDQALLHKINLL